MRLQTRLVVDLTPIRGKYINNIFALVTRQSVALGSATQHANPSESASVENVKEVP